MVLYMFRKSCSIYYPFLSSFLSSSIFILALCSFIAFMSILFLQYAIHSYKPALRHFITLLFSFHSYPSCVFLFIFVYIPLFPRNLFYIAINPQSQLSYTAFYFRLLLASSS